MKNIFLQLKSHHGLLSAFVMLLIMGSMASCTEDEFDTSAPPIIERIRNTNPTTADSSFVSATLGSTLAILGNNLSTTLEVYLNDHPLGVNPAYVTNNTVIVQISDSVPTVATNPDVVNKLRLVTRAGETTYDFQTLPPAPQVLQVKNQYVSTGDQLTLYGRYFYFVDTVYFPGEDVYVTSGIQTNAAGNTLNVTVPEGLDFTENANIVVVSRSGASATNRNTQIYSGLGMVADFDTPGVLNWPWDWGWGISGDMIRSSQPGISALDGNFGGMNQAFPANWGWNNDKVINLAAWSGEQMFPSAPANLYNPAAAAANFDIRFELAISSAESIEGLSVQIWYPDNNGNELDFLIPVNQFARTTDGSWYTFSANMTQLTNGNTRLNTYADFLAGDPGGVKQLRILIQNTTGNDIRASVGIDNIRIVRAVLP
ncbi:MAG TPA: glycan-binding surface protein [Anditalea sp.]|nr:glycan-binding surface protein [Anditalea sp.]